MSKNIKFEQKTVEVDGVEYTLQKPGIEETIKIRSRVLNGGDESQFVAYKEYLSKIVVNPKKEILDFQDSLSSLDRLMVKVESYLFEDTSKGKSKNSKEK